MFDVFDWTADILTMKIAIVSKELLLNMSPSPCPNNNLSPLTSQWARREFEAFKNIVKVWFETSKPTLRPLYKGCFQLFFRYDALTVTISGDLYIEILTFKVIVFRIEVLGGCH